MKYLKIIKYFKAVFYVVVAMFSLAQFLWPIDNIERGLLAFIAILAFIEIADNLIEAHFIKTNDTD